MEKNKMGVMPIPKLVISMSLPAIFAMLVQAMYNVVDSIFVSRISEFDNDGLTAISLAFPLQLIVIGVFVGLGVGMNSLISRRLGEKDHASAVLVAENGVLVGVCVYALIAILGSLFAKPFFELFTDNQIVISYATSYTRIVMIFSFGRILAQAGNSILQGTGEMIKPMIAMLIGALLNIILDPILIFGWFGIPAMGVKGAAIATVVAQIISMLYVWRVLLFGNNIIKPDLKNFKPMLSVIRQILVIGIPVALMQGIGSIMLFVINLILSQFGNIAIDVMGVYFRLQSMVFMPIFGLATGTMPIVGFNFGAKNRRRLKEAIRFSTIVAVCFMTFCFIIFQVFPHKLIGLFNPNEEMLTIGIFAFKRISLVFPIIGITIMFSTAFQAFGKAHYSLIVSVVRQIIIFLPIAYLLSTFNNINIIWYSFLVAETIGVILVSFLFRKAYLNSVGHWDIN